MGKTERAKINEGHKRARTRVQPQRYSERDKIAAVTAMLTTNRDHPQSNASFEAARLVLDAPQLSTDTLNKWMKEYREQVETTLSALTPVASVVESVRDNLAERWRNVVSKSMDALEDDDKIKNASFYHLVIAAGTGTDKLDRLTGIPSGTQVIVQRLMRVCAQRNIDYDVYLEDMIKSVEDEPIERTKYINTHAHNDTDEGRTDV